MTNLGNLGAQSEASTVEFGWFGAQIHARTGLSDLHYLDFMEAATDEAAGSNKSWAFVKDFARACIAEDDFAEFWRLAKANGQTQVNVHDVLMKLIEATTGRPTELPSGSSDGQQPTATKSTDSSFSVEARLEGRPDLQLLVQKAQESLAS